MTISYAHQIESLERMRGQSAFALFHEMGTGKSKIIIDEWAEAVQKGIVTSLIIIAPAGSYRNWLTQIKEHLDPEINPFVALWRSGKHNVEVNKLIKLRNRPRVLIANVEAFSTVAAVRDVCLNILINSPTTMVVDESTRIKSIDSKRTTNIIALGLKAKYRRIMSGLPTPQGPLDLFSQMYFLDYRILGYATFAAFRARYAIMKQIETNQIVVRYGKKMRHKIWIVAKYINEDELRERIAPYSHRVTKEECLDLPPKVYADIIAVQMTKEQRRIYQDLKMYALADLNNGTQVTATRVMTRMLRLHQCLCGHVMDDEKIKRVVQSNRLTTLLELLHDHSGKAIIWAPYDFNIREIAEAIRLEYGDVACFWGDNRAHRHEDEARWLTDPKCRHMVSTQSSGGVGNNWTAADLVIYYANNFNLEHRLQSEDRAHRSGQTKSVTYVDLMVPGTVDEVIVKALRKKIDLSTVINGDNYKEWII